MFLSKQTVDEGDLVSYPFCMIYKFQLIVQKLLTVKAAYHRLHSVAQEGNKERLLKPYRSSYCPHNQPQSLHLIQGMVVMLGR